MNHTFSCLWYFQEYQLYIEFRGGLIYPSVSSFKGNTNTIHSNVATRTQTRLNCASGDLEVVVRFRFAFYFYVTGHSNAVTAKSTADHEL